MADKKNTTTKASATKASSTKASSTKASSNKTLSTKASKVALLSTKKFRIKQLRADPEYSPNAGDYQGYAAHADTRSPPEPDTKNGIESSLQAINEEYNDPETISLTETNLPPAPDSETSLDSIQGVDGVEGIESIESPIDATSDEYDDYAYEPYIETSSSAIPDNENASEIPSEAESDEFNSQEGTPPGEMSSSPVPDDNGNSQSLLVTVGHGFVIGILLVAGFYFYRSYLPPAKEVEIGDLNPASNQTQKPTFNPPRSTIDRPIAIHDIVSNLMTDAVWDVHKIHFFKKNWMQLDAKEQAEIAGEKWFKRFQNELNLQINTPTNYSTLNKEHVLVYSSALADLQKLLAATTRRNATLDKEKHTEVATAGSSSGASSSTAGGGEIADTSIAAVPDPVEAINESTYAQVSSVAIGNTVSQSSLSVDTNTQKHSPQTTEVEAKSAYTPNISIENESPEKEAPGNTLAEPALNTFEGVASVDEKEHEDIIKNNDEILSKADQEQQIESDEKSNSMDSVQEVIAEQAAMNDQTFEDQQPQEGPSDETPRQNVQAKNTAETKKYYYVNGSIDMLRTNNDDNLKVSEVRDLTVQLSKYYESGDIKAFTSLFGNEQNNVDREALTHIKKQFEDWMSGTTDRQMFIKELNWAFHKNVAIGKGELSLTLISNHEPRVLTIKKSIELTVRKENQKVFITHFEGPGL